MKLKNTYKFAIKTAVYLTFLTSIFSAFLFYILNHRFDLLFLIISNLFVFILTFLIVQYSVKRFIRTRIKYIYDEISLPAIQNLDRNNTTTDIESLSEKVKKFAEDKHLEIEMLKIREEYRREFLGNVSHELKTPLFTVQGYLLTLIDGAMKDDEVRTKYLDRANKGIDRLINIVKDLDMISKLESSNIDLVFQPFDCIGLIEGVFDLLEIKSKKRNVRLVFDKPYTTPILAIADVKQIEHLLINLIENSVKYGKVNGRTEVSIQNYSSSQFRIKITDDGEGIEQQHLSRLFERFYRVDQSRSREQGGSGLGLSIVKHIVEAHKQKVFVESTLGQGTTFTFTLEKHLK